MSDLDQALLNAHKTNNKEALVQLYQNAANATMNEDERAFFLTHAYVFALDTGHTDAPRLKTELATMGREPK